MALFDDLSSDVQKTIDSQWNKRTGQKIPSTEDITLSGGAVELDATYLYSDLANSSKIAKVLDQRIAAKILKSFLSSTCRLIRHHDGSVISFDGDRLLGVFYGTSKNTSAAKCALQIKYAVTKIIRPKFESKYDSVKKADFNISHGTGIDTGKVLIVRAGARGANDLISIGRGPNLAAKLSEFREGNYNTFITASVYNMLHDSSKYGGKNNDNMWEKRSWKFLGENLTVYRSNWHWKP
ncbi:MAG: adenylate/guanylate cyclase domain-containing protein [Candidatus Paceibacterota bacterium]